MTQSRGQNLPPNAKKSPVWFDTYQAKKALGQKGAAWINIMSLVALVDLWKIPRKKTLTVFSTVNPAISLSPKSFTGTRFFAFYTAARRI